MMGRYVSAGPCISNLPAAVSFVTHHFGAHQPTSPSSYTQNASTHTNLPAAVLIVSMLWTAQASNLHASQTEVTQQPLPGPQKARFCCPPVSVLWAAQASLSTAASSTPGLSSALSSAMSRKRSVASSQVRRLRWSGVMGCGSWLSACSSLRVNSSGSLQHTQDELRRKGNTSDGWQGCCPAESPRQCA